MFSAVLAFGEALREALEGRVPIGETSTRAFPGRHLTAKMINPETMSTNIKYSIIYY